MTTAMPERQLEWQYVAYPRYEAPETRKPLAVAPTMEELFHEIKKQGLAPAAYVITAIVEGNRGTNAY